MARASTDFYGALGWMVGLLITLLISIPVLWFVTANASRGSRDEVLALGIAIAWWFNPLSLGALGYVLSNIRAWRLWTMIGLLIWAAVNVRADHDCQWLDHRWVCVTWIIISLSPITRLSMGSRGQTSPLLLRDIGMGCVQWADLLGDHQP
jgi:hypothetical protein